MLAVFAPDLAEARERELMQAREASSKLQDELKENGVEHY